MAYSITLVRTVTIRNMIHSVNNKILLTGFLAAMLCCIFCNSKKQKPLQPSPQLTLTASLGGTGSFLDTIGIYYIGTTLYNPGEDTIEFVTMTCSYEDMFTVNTDSFKVQSRYDCFSNYPIVIALAPKQRTDRYIMITRVGKRSYYDTSKLKVGMYLQVPKKGDNFDSIIYKYEHRQQGEVIWSNELDLKRLYKKSY